MLRTYRSMSKPHNREFINHRLAGANTGSHIDALAVGVAVGYCLDMPSGEVDNIETYYINMVEATSIGKVEVINTNIGLDIELVLDYVKLTFKWRYDVYQGIQPLMSTKSKNVPWLFGLSSKFTENEFEVINREEFIEIYKGYYNIVTEEDN